MSLFSTIAHEGPLPARGFSPKRIWMIAAGLALAAAVGLVIVNDTAEEPSNPATAAANRLSHDEFVRLNTTSLDGLVPAAAAVEAQGVVDRFIYMNTAAFDGLAPVGPAIEYQGEAPGLLHMITTALAYPPAGSSLQSHGPR